MNNLINLENRSFYICGEIITESLSEICFNIINLLDEDEYNTLNIVDFSPEPIKIFISSNGGEISPMWGLIDIMLNSKTPIYTYCIGIACSAAFKIFLAGSKRFGSKHSRFMYHQLGGSVNGLYRDMREYVETTAYLQNDVEEYVLSRTKITYEELEEIRKTKQDRYFNINEAMDYNIVTDII